MDTCRNIGIIAHIDAGKTTTSEQMLFLCGETTSVGRVDTGDTVMDFLPQERERGITIQAAAITLSWKSHRINLIDTPGHVDFTIEVERSVRVIDGAVIIVDAVSGVQAQTKTVWRQAQKQSLPAIAFINKMDRDGASFDRTLASIRTKLGANAVALQLPIFSPQDPTGGVGDAAFLGVVDLLTLTRATWNSGSGGDAHSSGQPSSRTPPRAVTSPLSTTDPLYASAVAARRALVERIVETDDVLLDQYLEKGEESVSVETLLKALRRACIRGQLVPTLCGASLRGKGVEPLLDSVLAFLPSPAERPQIQAVHRSDKSKPLRELDPLTTRDLCALAFKIVNDEARGPLVFVRTFTGSLTSKLSLLNATRGQRERVNQLLSVTADDLEQLAELGPGNVGCLVGLKHTVTGDTLVLDKGPLKDYVLAGLTVPRPVFSQSVEPEQTSQQAALEAALAVLCMEDPSLQVELDKESGQTLLRGLGELHLEIVRDKLQRQFGISVSTGRAYVAYRESLCCDGPSGAASRPEGGTEIVGGGSEGKSNVPAPEHLHSYTYDKAVGNRRMFASLTLGIEPLGDAGDPIVIVDRTATMSLTADEKVSLVEAIHGALSRGPRGYPVVGLRVSVVNVQRDADTTPGAVRACCAILIDQVLRSPRKHALLEPLMQVEVEAPAEFVGEVLNDLTVKRRGLVREVFAGGAAVASAAAQGSSSSSSLAQQPKGSVILAQVPLATMLGYASTLRSATRGEGSFSMEFECYSGPIDSAVADGH